MTPEKQSIHLVGRLAKLERELEQERQDRKQAELDVCRALGERNDARAMVNSLRSLVTTEHESKESFIYRVAVTLSMPSRAQMDAQLGERNDARGELARLKAVLEDPAEVELAMIRGDIAIPHRVEFDGIRDTPAGDNL